MMARHRALRAVLKTMGYRLRKHGEVYNLIETKTDTVKVKDSTLEDIAEWVWVNHFTPPKS